MTTPKPPTFTKTANEILDYRFDLTSQLTEDGGDTISTAAAEAETGITITAEETDTTGHIVWISGGTLDEIYTVTALLQTLQGRTYERTIYIRIIPEI